MSNWYTEVDENGQPLNRFFNRKRRRDRTVDELIGMAKGMASDGMIVQAEAEFLLSWLQRNREFRDQFPVDMLTARVTEMLADGVLDQEEQEELLTLLKNLSGMGEVYGEDGSVVEVFDELATSLPLTQPLPAISFEGKCFCFTGKFVCGTRKEVEATVKSLGNRTVSQPSQKTDYLVIGVLGSKDWMHTSYGRKIEHASKLNGQGHGVAIISEDHWISSLLMQERLGDIPIQSFVKRD